jgi:penicillin-binding protein 2
MMFAVFFLFSIRMYQLQIVQHTAFQAAADDNRLNQLPVAAQRGVIYDRNGRILAGNAPAFNVTIIPAELPGTEAEDLSIFDRLSALVDIPPTRETAIASGRDIRSIEELVAEGEGIAPFRAVVIAQDVPFHVALQIKEERITMPGVDVLPASVREYPTGELTSHLVGYMAPIPAEEAQELIEQGYDPAFDRIGIEGVERYLEDILGGTRGSRLREIDVAGEEIRQLEQIEPIPGQSVRLTIDLDLQAAAEKALRDRITLLNATAGRIISQQGVVIAMNPSTGEILAMVSWPGYDNSRFARAIDVPYYLDISADPIKPLVNNAIKGLYAPGSVWKLITAAGVLQEHVIDPNTQLFDGGDLIVENRYAPNDPAAAQRFVCWLDNGHGRVNMIQGIAWSCDVYFYQVGGGNDSILEQTLRKGGLGDRDLFRYATAFGIGSELGVELPFESSGRMPDRDWKRRNYGENWSTGDTYNAAFGQGYVTVTPLQLLASVAAMANGGTLYQPTIIRELLDEGGVAQPFTPQVLRNVNIDNFGPNDPITLLLVEDMIMKGPSSLACTCESDSPYYNPLRCDPQNYRNTVDINSDQFIEDLHPYRVDVPLNYTFNASVCQELRFNEDYSPAFVSTGNLDIVQEGMRQAVIGEGGTANGANLAYVEVAGKTGTAEYCDNIARPLGLCIPGNWPAHAWFTAYAPYEKPEIIIIAFVYNGGEGSAVALPVVVETMEAYFRLKGIQPTSPQNINPILPGP